MKQQHIIEFRAFAQGVMIYERDIAHLSQENTDILRLAKFFCNVPNNAKLMQWTGLKDKNGKEIYEGDIVESNCINFLQYKISIVTFSNGSYHLELPNKHWVQNWNSDDVIVIGNIHEHPSLLNS